MDVTSSEHCVFGLQRRDEAGHDVGNIAPPFLLAATFQSRFPDIILIGALLVGQMTKLHGLNNAVNNHGRSEPGSEAEKKHLAAAVAPQGLHGSVIDDLHGATECRHEIEPNPPTTQVVWFGDRSAAQHWGRKAARTTGG